MDNFSPFFLFLSFVISLNKPLIVPNEKGGYSFYVLVIKLEQQENYEYMKIIYISYIIAVIYAHIIAVIFTYMIFKYSQLHYHPFTGL